MPIRPTSNFRTRASLDNAKIDLPSDNRAAPYRELASLGQGMNAIATDMWQISERNRIETEVNQLLERDALMSSDAHKFNETAMRNRKDGLVGEGDKLKGKSISYSQAIYDSEDAITNQLEMEASDETVRNMYKARVAATKRERKVKALTYENEYKLASKIDEDKRITQEANIAVSVAPKSSYMEDGLAVFNKRSVQYKEDVMSGMYDNVTAESLDSHAGTTAVKTLMDKMVIFADLKAFNTLLDTPAKQRQELDDLQKQLIDRGVVPATYFKEQEADPKSAERYAELRKFVTPQDAINTYAAILRALENKTNKDKLEYNQDVRNLKGNVQAGLTDNIDVGASVKTLNSRGKALGVPANVRASTFAEMQEDIQMRFVEKQIASMPYDKQLKLKDRYVEHIGKATETSLNDPEISALMKKDPNLMGDVKGRLSLKFDATAKQIEFEKQKQSADFALKHNPDLADAFASASKNNIVGQMSLVSKAMREYQIGAGVRKRNLRLAPSEYSAKVGAELEEQYLMGSADSLTAVSNTLTLLSRTWAGDFPALMNELVENKHLSQAHESLALVAHIPDKRQMRNALDVLYNSKENKAAFDEQNKKKDGRLKYNLGYSMAKLKGELSPYLNSYLGENTSPKALTRNRQYMDLVQAQFYKLRATPNRMNADEDEDDTLIKAQKMTFDSLFTKANYKGNKVLAPSLYQISSEHLEAGVSVLLERASTAPIDIERYKAQLAPLLGISPETSHDIIEKRFRERLVVVSPPPTGYDSDGAGLYVALRTHRGTIPFLVKTPEGGTSELTLPFATLKQDPDVMRAFAEGGF